MRMAGAGAVVLLGACQSIIPRAGQRPVELQQPLPPPEIEQPANPIAGDRDRHRVALLVPTTGPNSDIGQSIANATIMALLDTRTDSVRITTYDTSKGAAAAARAAVQDGNRLILGPLLGEDVLNAAGVARQAGVPILSFSNDSKVAGPGVFLMGPTPAQSIERVVAYARANGMSRFAGLVPDNLYGTRASDALGRAVAASGASLVTVQRYGRSNASLAAAVKALGSPDRYDALLIGDGGSAVAAAAPLVRKTGSTAKFLGTELWNTEARLASVPALRGAWFASIPDTLYRQYADRYRDRFGKAPFRLSSLGYDAVLLVIRVAQDWRIGAPFPVRRMTDPDGFMGVDGSFRFRPNGTSERLLEVQEVRAGSFATIDPAPRRFGD